MQLCIFDRNSRCATIGSGSTSIQLPSVSCFWTSAATELLRSTSSAGATVMGQHTLEPTRTMAYPGHRFWIGCLRSCDGTELRTCKWLGSTWARWEPPNGIRFRWDQWQATSISPRCTVARWHRPTGLFGPVEMKAACDPKQVLKTISILMQNKEFTVSVSKAIWTSPNFNCHWSEHMSTGGMAWVKISLSKNVEWMLTVALPLRSPLPTVDRAEKGRPWLPWHRDTNERCHL